jgi:hypothetical protein
MKHHRIRGLVLGVIGFFILVTPLSTSQLVTNETPRVITNTSVETDKASAAAPPIAAQICMKGLSGQVVEGGFSISSADAFCDLIKMSDVLLAASEYQRAQGNTHYADLYMSQYHEALRNANDLVTKTQTSAVISRFFSDMVLPLLLVGGLIFLL